jgi:phosphoglycerate dehydrogenase-like enzyme
MGAKNPFRVGITHDFETHAKGVLAPALAEVFDRAGGIEYEIMPDTGGVGAPEKLDAYDGIIVLDYAFPAPSFQGLSRLAVLARWGVGCDRLDLNAATEADVIVAITTDSVRRPVAEGIFALIFALARNLRALDRNIRAGDWRRDPPRVIDIEGRTLGSIGLGNIAGEMFRMARGVGFGRLLAHDPSAEAPEAERLDVKLTDLDTVMRESDFITVNCPLTPQSRGLIGARQLELMKPTAFLINTARGEVLNEPDLVAVLRERRIAGAGLDVFATEPISAGHPLLEMDNVVLSPHLIARSEDCVRNTSLSACRNVLAVQRGTAPPYVANPKVLSRPRVRARLPHLND